MNSRHNLGASKVVDLGRFRAIAANALPAGRCIPPATPEEAIDQAIASFRRGDLAEWELELIRNRCRAVFTRR